MVNTGPPRFTGKNRLTILVKNKIYQTLRFGVTVFLCICLPLQVDCNNYVRLLEFLGDGRVYVCGTYAFDPQCAFLVS